MCEVMRCSTSQGNLPTFEEARGASTRRQASEPPSTGQGQERGRHERQDACLTPLQSLCITTVIIMVIKAAKTWPG